MKRIFSGLLMLGVVSLVAGCPGLSGGGLYGGGDGGSNDNGGAPSGDGVARNFSATLAGAQEVPAVDTAGAGTGTFALDADHTELTFDVTVTGLSGPVVAAHFHIGPPGTSGNVAFAITPTVFEAADGTVTATGVWTLDEANATNLLDGNVYVNFHTDNNPGGEVRGQLVLEE